MQVKKMKRNRKARRMMASGKHRRTPHGHVKRATVAFKEALEMNKNKTPMVRVSPSGKGGMSPVFKSKEQEQLFAKCAEESMSTTAVLEW